MQTQSRDTDKVSSWAWLPLIAVLTLSVATSYGGQQPTDVLGWQDVRWNTSPQNLKDLYGSRLTVERSSDRQEIQTIKNYELFGEPFEVRFLWKGQNRLMRVSIGLHSQRDLSSVAEDIVASLRSKYGSGMVVEHEDTKSAPFQLGGQLVSGVRTNRLKIRWSFPSTLITYEHQIIALDPTKPFPSFISIFYEPNETGKL